MRAISHRNPLSTCRRALMTPARTGPKLWACSVQRFSTTPDVARTGQTPTIQDAREQPREPYEMPHDVLLALAAHGDEGAREERMVREIMAVDGVDWDAAQPSEYRAPHQDFGGCREIGAKTHCGSIRSHFCVRPAPRPADAKATVAECTCTVYGTVAECTCTVYGTRV
eukprot:COSAG01_NODE_9171_length_2529_cov_51.727572_2_plen_169_part_00